MKWHQFLQDDKRFFSAARLGYLVCLLFSTAIMLWIAYNDKMTEQYMLNYMGVFALGYVGGKWAGKDKNVTTRNKRV